MTPLDHGAGNAVDSVPSPMFHDPFKAKEEKVGWARWFNYFFAKWQTAAGQSSHLKKDGGWAKASCLCCTMVLTLLLIELGGSIKFCEKKLQ